MQIPKAKQRQSSHQWLFVLLGSSQVMAAHETLVKLTLGLNFINVLRTAFTCAEPKRVKKAVKLSVILHFCALCVQKLRVNMLVKLTSGLTYSIALKRSIVNKKNEK